MAEMAAQTPVAEIMPLSEDTLSSWSAAPSQTETDRCINAETAVKKAIAADTRLSAMDITVFAQGSYAARTNVRQGSDVDICVRYKSSFYTDYPAGLTNEMLGLTTSSFTFSEFKTLVGTALSDFFGHEGVRRGNKA